MKIRSKSGNHRMWHEKLPKGEQGAQNYKFKFAEDRKV